jgi:hypothetical protein
VGSIKASFALGGHDNYGMSMKRPVFAKKTDSDTRQPCQVNSSDTRRQPSQVDSTDFRTDNIMVYHVAASMITEDSGIKSDKNECNDISGFEVWDIGNQNDGGRVEI